MIIELIRSICEARMIVGFLGEKHQAGWWDCAFLSSASTAFLAPVFPNSIRLAQYRGICQAASIVHDEHIGIGKHYHLYRLPDSIERNLAKCFQDKKFTGQVSEYISTRDRAINRLKKIGTTSIDRAEGPVVVGDFSDAKLDDLLKSSIAHYVHAFEAGYQTFPYLRCQ